MITIERIQRAREGAVDLYHKTIIPNLGIVPCARGKYRKELFTRDHADSVIQGLSQPENRRLPGFLEAAKQGMRTIHQHQGTSFVADSDEEPGRYPHEVHTEDSPQGRLRILRDAGHPVRMNPQTKKLSLVNFYAGDASALGNRADRIIIASLDDICSTAQGDEYAEEVWSHMDVAMQSDIENASRSELGMRILPVVNPRNSINFIAQCWRDGKEAYTDDERRKLSAPVIFFSNACQSIAAAEDVAEVADRLGYLKRARELRLWAEEGRDILDRLFWNEDLQTYVPAYGNRGQIKFINCDPVDGLDCGVIPEVKARVVAQGLLDRLWTPDGLRSRSIDSPRYTEKGRKAYQNGNLWPQRTTKFVLGCIKYNLISEAEQGVEGATRYVEEAGFKETKIYTRDGQLKDYFEDGKLAACDIQSWFLYGYLAVSAWALRRYHLQTLTQPRLQYTLSA